MKTESNFDGTQGRCCCYTNNRRGFRIILLFDLVFAINILRWPFAVGAKYFKKYALYAKIRRITFWLQAVIGILTIIGLITADVMISGGSHYSISIGVVAGTALLVGIDYHWTEIVTFYANHPKFEKNKPIDWI